MCALSLGDGTPVSERLTMLDDSHYAFAYTFVVPCFPCRTTTQHSSLFR